MMEGGRLFKSGKEEVAFLKKSSAKDFLSWGHGWWDGYGPGSKKVFAELFSKSDRLLPFQDKILR
jgi:hypothetical protein